jgi:c-di-GMP-binding flagellar brake protein YcgR
VQVYFQTPSGRFGFRTRILKPGKRLVEVAHSEHIRRLQRREFFRAQVALPVKMRKLDSAEEAVDATLIEMGGGGGSMKNPDQRFQIGDQISISIHFRDEDPIDMPGRIVRSSGRGRIVHVQFEFLSEGDRDRLIGYLFRRPQV